MGFLLRILGYVGFTNWILPAVIATVGLASVGGAYIKGRLDSSANCHEATLQAKIAILNRDAAVQKAADEVAATAMADLQSMNNSMQMELSDYETELKTRPDAKCTILILILSACASSGAKIEPSRNLPSAPSCMATVVVPAVNVGDDARDALARHSIALSHANGNLKCSKAWYQKVRSAYGAK